MSEAKLFGPETQESIEKKKERLMPIFRKSLEIMQNPDMDFNEGLLVVTRKMPNGTKETLDYMLVMDIDEDGPNLAYIKEDGEPSASATILWKEIIDAKIMAELGK